MSLLFNWRLWAAGILALAFGAGCWKSYVAGKNSVQAQFDAYRAEQTAQALSESVARRHREETYQSNYAKAKNEAAKQKALRIAADAALDNGLREFQTANSGTGNEQAAAGPGTNGTGGLERELLNHCAGALVAVGKEADRLEAKVIGLQDYIKSIGLDK